MHQSWRRRITVTFTIVAALVVAGVVMLVVRPFASAPAPTVAASPTPGVLDIASALNRQAAALVAGDEQGWLAPVSSRNRQLQAEYRKQFKQLRALGVTSFQPVFDGQELDLFRLPPAPAKVEVPLTVFFGYCAQTADCPYPGRGGSSFVADTEGFTAKLLWILDNGRFVISSFTRVTDDVRARSVPPWLTDDLQTHTGRRVTVAASAALAGHLTTVAALADRAAGVAQRYARWTKPTRYIVYLADESEWRRWYGGPGKDADVLGFALTNSLSSVPVVLNYTHISAEDLSSVLRHEFGHVATLIGTLGGRDYLTEGIAEYVEEHGQPVASYHRLGDLRRYLRSGAWDGDIDSAKLAVYSDAPGESSAAYAVGYLTLRCIANRYGEKAMFTFVDHTVRRASGPAEAAPTALGRAWSAVKRTCGAYIRTVAG